MNVKTTDAIKNHIPQVLEHYRLPPITRGKHFKGECPICGKKGKFRIDNKRGNGDWICSCGNGNIWKLLELTQGKDFVTLAKEINELIGIYYERKQQSPKPISNIKDFREKALKKFHTLKPLVGTAAEEYLINRNIRLQGLQHLQHIRFTENGEKGTVFNAICAMADDKNGNVCYLHKTILDGNKKADIAVNKKMTSLQEPSYLEYAESVAIRLFPVASTLGIAEGIETALSCHQIYKCNVWPTMNAGFMKKFIAPIGVEHLIIFSDTDNNFTGHAAAFECARRNITSQHNNIKKVTIRWPEQGDFNDVLTNGAKVYEWSQIRSSQK